MNQNQYKYCFYKLIPYVDRGNSNKENIELLCLMLDTINDECFIKYFSELYHIFSITLRLDFSKAEEDLKRFIKNCRDKEFINDVFATAAFLNSDVNLLYQKYRNKKFYSWGLVKHKM